jgi:hypothetical protein
VSAASGGNIAAAAAQYSQCNDPKEKGKCKNAAQRGAQSAVLAAIGRHDCNGARAIAQAAKGMGLNTTAIDNAVAKCQ